MKKYSFPIIAFVLIGCSFMSGNKTVRIELNPKKAGWYYIQLIRDTTIKDTGLIVIQFNDSPHFARCRINDINHIVMSPFDNEGNDISSRLKYVGVNETGRDINFFEFYNPSDDELKKVKNWTLFDKHDRDTRNKHDIEFNRLYKDSVNIKR